MEDIQKIIEQIDEYFSDPKNVEDFGKYLEKEMKKPCFTHLQCCEVGCKYNRPKNPDIGTITWCSKYKDNEEGKKLCEKECKNRTYYIFNI